ncbi:serine/threonine protein phosphatase [Sphingorhabdus sp. IMCC26285]|uniref:Serine/threonine protein phosphatase n=1 Tax=Sphingorhabdus profundilacus TaxID=2509718 RepID=A0A6I4LW19_9SPHN|nr:metallophosphoesterase family protein [Sphingorhabdus profundilacus]MVZ97572.1 serine/threonine protein phosphatase [Sphingorhabdus profundilacus]
MLGRFFKKTAKLRPLDTARVPDGMRVYAIGDVHGCNHLLHDLLMKIEADDLARGPAETLIIFLGDLMDRGPDSAGVIETAMALRKAGRNVRFLMGNHEEVFVRACRKNDPKVTRFFIRIGGEATVLSYPITRSEYIALDMHQLSERLGSLVPESHLDFIDSFEDQIVIGDYVFVHAGIRPGVPLAEQKPSDLRWIREDFVEQRGDLEKVVVYGHTIYDSVEERGSRIGIDTGAYASAELTAIGLEGGERWYLQT